MEDNKRKQKLVSQASENFFWKKVIGDFSTLMNVSCGTELISQTEEDEKDRGALMRFMMRAISNILPLPLFLF